MVSVLVFKIIYIINSKWIGIGQKVPTNCCLPQSERDSVQEEWTDKGAKKEALTVSDTLLFGPLASPFYGNMWWCKMRNV